MPSSTTAHASTSSTPTRACTPHVAGTVEALRLAALASGVPLHYVSTGSVMVPEEGAAGPVGEDGVLAPELLPDSGYVRGKWVAERLVVEAGRRGLPVAIYRPGRVGGHTATGAADGPGATAALARASGAPEPAGSGIIRPPIGEEVAYVRFTLEEAYPAPYTPTRPATSARRR